MTIITVFFIKLMQSEYETSLKKSKNKFIYTYTPQTMNIKMFIYSNIKHVDFFF